MNHRTRINDRPVLDGEMVTDWDSMTWWSPEDLTRDPFRPHYQDNFDLNAFKDDNYITYSEN